MAVVQIVDTLSTGKIKFSVLRTTQIMHPGSRLQLIRQELLNVTCQHEKAKHDFYSVYILLAFSYRVLLSNVSFLISCFTENC